jgi:hypothetical protein
MGNGVESKGKKLGLLCAAAESVSVVPLEEEQLQGPSRGGVGRP